MKSLNRISVSWVTVADKIYAVALDLSNNSIIYELLDYSIHMSKRRAFSPLTVRCSVYHLTRFFSWVSTNKLKIELVNDDSMEQFRESELIRLQSDILGSQKAHKRTINARLIVIYQYLIWLQWRRPDLINLIGDSKSQVTSSLKCDSAGKILRSRSRSSGYYPKLFPDSGSGARHRQAHEATVLECDKIKMHFIASHNSYVAERNILMMEIMEQVGLRRGALNSLRCSQFDVADNYFDERSFLRVVPDSQKFSYERSFEFLPILVLKIQRFISTHRAWLVGEKCLSLQDTADRVFLSYTTGKPLHNVSVSGVFSDAFDSIGVTSRASCHSFRHKFANDTIHDEIIMRKEAGVDTSDSSIAFAVASRLGQANPMSILPYVSNGQIKFASTLRKEDHDLKVLREENARLMALLDKAGDVDF